MSFSEWFGGAKEPWRKLVDAKSVEVFDEGTGEVFHIPPEQPHPGHIEGLLVRFLYCDATGRSRRRLVLCRRCWASGNLLYINGFCAMVEAMRTFRVDRMTELEEVRTDRTIGNIDAYFRAYAELGGSDDVRAARVVGSERAAPKQDIEHKAFRRHVEHRARDACIAGLRVLAYVALTDDVLSEAERNIEMSFIESRLAMTGLDHDVHIAESLLATARALAVPLRSFTIAVNWVAKDQAYFALTLSCARLMARLDGITHPTEESALGRLVAAGETQGWSLTAH